MSQHDNQDDDSVIITIQPPKEEKAKMTSVMPTYELLLSPPESNFIKIHYQVNSTYLRNLMRQKQDSQLPDEVRRKKGPNCVIYHQFQFTHRTQDGKETIDIVFKADIAVIWEQYRGLEIQLDTRQYKVGEYDYKFARLIFQLDSEKRPSRKSYPMDPLPDSKLLAFTIDDRDLQTYLKPSLAMEITIMQQPVRQPDYRGIRNEGCTCYMNSTLQILFFIRPLRKIIIEYSGTSKLVVTLQSIFCELMDLGRPGSHLHSIDAYDLIKADGRFDTFPLKQQDIHQFLFGFLDELETVCGQLKELWLGNSQQMINSIEKDKPYQSNINEDYNCLDLQLEDSKGNTFKSLIYSLQALVHSEKVEDRIDTDQYGKVAVSKQREFVHLPNLVFMNLKRYMYRAEKQRPIKIMAEFTYPQDINLGFLQKTPTGEEEEYVLFALAVHAGQAYNSGHYFSFVNTSPELDNPKWVKFNDSTVTLSSKQEVLSFIGGKRRVVEWSNQYQRFISKDIINEQTAYLLAYLRRDKFEQYQKVACAIPRDYFTKRQVSQREEDHEPMVNCEVLLFDSKDKFDPFRDDPPTVPVTLRSKVNIFNQLKNNIIPGVNCGIQLAFKVFIKKRKMVSILNYVDIEPTPFRFLQAQPIKPDYLLLVPEKTTVVPSIANPPKINQKKKLLYFKLGQTEKDAEFHIVASSRVEDFITESEQRLGCKGNLENAQRFLNDWNDYGLVDFRTSLNQSIE